MIGLNVEMFDIIGFTETLGVVANVKNKLDGLLWHLVVVKRSIVSCDSRRNSIMEGIDCPAARIER